VTEGSGVEGEVDGRMPPDGEQEQPASVDLPTIAPAPRREPPWSVWDVLLVAVVFIVIDVAVTAAAALVAVRMAHMAWEDALYNAWIVVPAQLVAYAAGLAFMYWLVTHTYGRPFWATVRWHWPTGLGKAAGLILIGTPMAVATSYLESVLPMPSQLPLEQLFTSATTAYLMAGLAVLAAPFLEELFFRGFLYPVLRRVGAAFGVVVTALAFAAVHGTEYAWSVTAVTLLFGVGLVLTIARARSGSVVPGFLIHVGYNLTLFVFMFISSDHFRHFERM